MNRLVLPTFVVCLSIVGQESVGSSCGDTCCAFFYRKDGKCIDCPNGTTRLVDDSENSCTTCVGTFYGWKCFNVCTCTPNERCDNVYGCVQTQTSTKESITTMTKNQVTKDATSRQKNTIMSLSFYISGAAALIIITGCVLAVRSNRSRLTQSKCSNEKTVHLGPRIIPEINIDEPDEDSTVQDEDLYCEIRASQIVQASHLSPWHVGTNDNTLLRASNVYNHLSFYHSTPNLDSCVAGIYDQSNPYPILQNIKRRNSTDGVYIEPEASTVPCNIKEEMDGYGQVWQD